MGKINSRNFRRKSLATLEVNRMVAKYHDECIDFPPRMETPEEKAERLKADERRKRAEERKNVIKP